MRLASGNSAFASQVILKLLCTQTSSKESAAQGLSENLVGIDPIIANRLRHYIERLKSNDGSSPNQQQEALIAILTALFFLSPGNEIDTTSDREVRKNSSVLLRSDF